MTSPATASPPWPDRTLRRLLIAVGLIVFALIGGTVVGIIRLHGQTLDDASQQMARLALIFSDQTSRAIETIDLMLRDTADIVRSRDAMRDPDLSDLAATLRRRTQGVQQILQVAVAGPDGRVRVTSGPGTAAALPKPAAAALAWYAAHSDDGLRISEPFALDSDRLTVLLTRPVANGEGVPPSVVIAYLNLDYFETLFRAVELNQNGAILLHRRDGVVLARVPQHDEVIGTSYAGLPPWTTILNHATAGTLLMTSPIDGSTRVLAVRALRQYPLVLNVSLDADLVLAVWRRQVQNFSLLAVGVLVLGGIGLRMLYTRAAPAPVPQAYSAAPAGEAANTLTVWHHTLDRVLADPRLPSDLAAHLRPLVGPGEAAPALIDANRTRAAILLVLDDAGLRAATAAMLRDAGYAVYLSTSGLEALAVLAGAVDISLLIADFALPELPCATLIDRARALRNALPALVLADSADIGACPVPGLSKPYRQAELVAAVERALRPPI